MNTNFSLFLLFSVLVTGLIISPVYAQEPPVNATETMTESNSTSSGDEAMVVGDELKTEIITGSSNSTATEEEMVATEEVMEESEIIPIIPSPLKQIKEGIAPENIVCKEGLELVFKLNGQPACIKTTSVQKLIAWGWTQ